MSTRTIYRTLKLVVPLDANDDAVLDAVEVALDTIPESVLPNWTLEMPEPAEDA